MKRRHYLINTPFVAKPRHHKKALGIIAPLAGAALGSIIPGVGTAIGAAAGSGLATKAKGGSWLDALKSGGLSYAGSSIGGAVGDKLGLGTVGSNFGSTTANAVGPGFMDTGLGSLIGEGASNSLGSAVANTSLGSIAGGFAGNSLMEMPQESATATGATPFTPTRAGQQDLPGSLQGFGGLAQDQISSNIATQGVYGQGNGPQEQSYFNNLINRRLVDDSGNVDADLSEISPIESSYLQKLGLGGYKNSKDLLEAMSKWKAA